MITLRMEFQKIKRKKIGLTMCALICVQFAWLLWSGSHPDENERLQGWIETLYSLPLVSVIMMLNCFLLYQVSPITERYEIGGSPDKVYGSEEIAVLRDYVVEQANALAPSFERDEKGYIIYKKDIREKARQEMRRLGGTFENLQGYYPKPKGLCL